MNNWVAFNLQGFAERQQQRELDRKALRDRYQGRYSLDRLARPSLKRLPPPPPRVFSNRLPKATQTPLTTRQKYLNRLETAIQARFRLEASRESAEFNGMEAQDQFPSYQTQKGAVNRA